MLRHGGSRANHSDSMAKFCDTTLVMQAVGFIDQVK